MSLSQIELLADKVSEKQKEMPAGQAMLAGISGIDASGKGYIARQLNTELHRRGLRTALIPADDWLNLPHVRFSKIEPGLHFYQYALRLDEMFEQLVLPLKTNRSISLTADLTRETAKEHYTHTYRFENIDLIVIEGIFIFKPLFSRQFDLRVWVECSFQTALQRAIARSQEGLDEAATIRSYKTTYFPAQSIHLNRDHPVAAADMILVNS